MEIEGLKPPVTFSLWFLSHQTFIFLFFFCSLEAGWKPYPLLSLPFVLFFLLFFIFTPFLLSQPPIPQNVFIASLEPSSPAVRADTGVWFVRVSVIQRSIRSIRPIPGTPGGLGLCLAKPLTETKPLSGKPLSAQQAQKNEPPLSLHIRSLATVADPPQTASHLIAVCPSLWTRDS